MNTTRSVASNDHQDPKRSATPRAAGSGKENSAPPSPASTDDRELVRSAQRGDADAFKVLVTRYQRRAYRIAYAMLRNPSDAMDATQDAFIKVHRYLPHFQGASSFYTWLYRIVVNICIDQMRRGKSAQAGGSVEFDDRIDHGGEGGPLGGVAVVPRITDGNPGQAASRRELGEQIHRALETLPPYHRAVIVMREIEGMSYKEMAKVMRVSKGTIMSRLFHARRKMQVLLRAYLRESQEPGEPRKGPEEKT